MKKVALLLGVLSILTMSAAAEIPRLITYQGRLTDDAGAPVADGGYSVTFCIYGSESGTDTLWTSGAQSVTVADGLFAYTLGANVALEATVFDGAERYLGITVGSDPEISPRARLTSSAFSYHAAKADVAEIALTPPDNVVKTTGDTMSGSLFFDGGGNGIDGQLEVSNDYANLFLYNNGNRKAALYGQGYGAMVLTGGNGINSIYMDARESQGGLVQLRDNAGTNKIILNAEIPGDSAVVLPHNSINSLEIDNEPGISESDGWITLTCTTFVFIDVEVDTITIPAPGYVFAIGTTSLSSYLDVTTNSGTAYIQIDTGSVGAWNNSTTRLVVDSTTGFTPSTPVTVFRSIYFDAAGTYEIKLQVGDWDNFASFDANFTYLTCMFFPTAYGSVPSSVSQPMAELTGQRTASTSGFTKQKSIKELELEIQQAKIEEQAARIRRLEAELKLKNAKEKKNK